MKLSLRCGVVAILLFLSVSDAVAACARLNSGDKFTVETSANLGLIHVSTEDPIGKVLKKTKVHWVYQDNNQKVQCTGGSEFIAVPVKNYGVHDLNARILKTNIPGIGLRVTHIPASKPVWASATPGKLDLPGRKNLAEAVYSLPSGDFEIEVIKIGRDIKRGTLSSGIWAEWRYDRIQAPLQTLSIEGYIEYQTPTCKWRYVPNQLIHLKEVSTKDFNGVGSTVGGQNFEVNVDCYPGVAGTVMLRPDFQAKGNQNTVIENTAGSVVRAKGVDLQLVSSYQNTQTLVSNGMRLVIAKVLNKQARRLVVPFTVKYYQSDSRVTGGSVQAKVTLRLDYE